MLDNCAYIDAQQRMQHLRCIEIISEKLHRPAEEVAPLYEEVLTEFAQQAVIHDYLTIFTSKKVSLIFSRARQGNVAN